ncbi:MATE family efflux transporter [Hathewaya limosa]|uniref:Probable multidrug resistance protein NorM n=1 Tax=Hathewaya limosa TaxID=1536 RepID=A0ABU0JY17_HATLI|nr:MATE family efflux transporter [Hathewaya limosa]MDQ0481043.1 putative MATE family efflux protein [Hathewaya limosa]
MTKTNNLVQGGILKSLVSLALPIMGTSFIQMAYNMTDMIWIGRTGSLAVAAVGTASFFTWFGQSFILLSKTGAEIGVSQSLGREDINTAKSYVCTAIQLNILCAILYSIILIFFKSNLIGFFNLNSNVVIKMAETYLVFISLGLIFNFINPVLTGIFNGMGNSKTPFKINTVGLILNIFLDPMLIFGFGPIPALGVTGAAIATVLAQTIVTILFLYEINKINILLFKINLFKSFKLTYLKEILKLGLPVAIQNGLLSFFAMIIGRIISVFGDTAIAVQKVGTQIEAISWMTAGGFSSAISAFVGQNYGAKKINRIFKGYSIALKVVSIIGVITSLLLILFAKPLFCIFIREPEAVSLGVDYLKILGVSQFFMCIEITTGGAFNGLGKTYLPAIISIVFTGLRIPFALLLSKSNLLGLNGVWWSISISSIFKGIILVMLFIILIIRNKKFISSFNENLEM